MFDFDKDDVPGRYWTALRSFSNSINAFEPLAKRGRGVGPKTAEWLLERGLIETGENPRYSYSGFGACYRVSELGWRVLDRGRWAKR